MITNKIIIEQFNIKQCLNELNIDTNGSFEDIFANIDFIRDIIIQRLEQLLSSLVSKNDFPFFDVNVHIPQISPDKIQIRVDLRKYRKSLPTYSSFCELSKEFCFEPSQSNRFTTQLNKHVEILEKSFLSELSKIIASQ